MHAPESASASPPYDATTDLTSALDAKDGVLPVAGALPAVPGYDVSEQIGSGGMGLVFAAHDPAFDREVAIKVTRRATDAAQFVIEAKVTAQLPHPGVPPVYALGKLADGRPFLAMKLIRGRTLSDELKAPNRTGELAGRASGVRRGRATGPGAMGARPAPHHASRSRSAAARSKTVTR
ncbi:MAG: hypothetical protein FJ304_17980 [Planctomycetes bacterium]|nr:hypothetical protein [Planctomycetota bacterium]